MPRVALRCAAGVAEIRRVMEFGQKAALVRRQRLGVVLLCFLGVGQRCVVPGWPLPTSIPPAPAWPESGRSALEDRRQ